MGCSDADECALHSDNCDRDHGFCENSIGGWECKCATGWEFVQTKLLALGIGVNDGKTCVDIDECAAGSDWCNENISQCFNEIGDFSCHCHSGYQAEI